MFKLITYRFIAVLMLAMLLNAPAFAGDDLLDQANFELKSGPVINSQRGDSHGHQYLKKS